MKALRLLQSLLTSAALLAFSCGLFAPRPSETPDITSSTTFSDPWNLLYLMGISGKIAQLSDYDMLFSESAQYLVQGVPVSNRTGWINHLKAWPVQCSYLAVTWQDTLPFAAMDSGESRILSTSYQIRAVKQSSDPATLKDTIRFDAPSRIYFSKVGLDRVVITRWEDGYTQGSNRYTRSIIDPSFGWSDTTHS